MGNFYVNFTTRGPDRAAVANSLRSAKRTAFIAPTVDGLTVFYDEESDNQDDAEIKYVGETVSKDLGAAVFAVLNHDDDILAYWLFDRGELVDEYNSCPSYFEGGDDTPAGGNAAKLCAAFGVPEKIQEVDEILHKSNYVFAVERHMALGELLKTPFNYSCLGYRYISEGELPEGAGMIDLERID